MHKAPSCAGVSRIRPWMDDESPPHSALRRCGVPTHPRVSQHCELRPSPTREQRRFARGDGRMVARCHGSGLHGPVRGQDACRLRNPRWRRRSRRHARRFRLPGGWHGRGLASRGRASARCAQRLRVRAVPVPERPAARASRSWSSTTSWALFAQVSTL